MSEVEMICTMRDGEIDCTAQLLIRCEHCEYFERYEAFNVCKRHGTYNFKVKPNDFCSRAALNYRMVE